jgi:Ser/Thr protein kinase RdoA (MazF antagonist)
MPTPDPSAPIPPRNADTLRRVLAAFGIGEPESIRRLRAGTGASHKFIIDTDDRPGVPDRLFLKQRPRTDTIIAELLAHHRVLAHLAGAGVPVPLPLPTRDGGTLLIGESSVFELVPYVEAEPWEGTPSHATAAGRTLAVLHTALAALDPHDLGALRPDRGLFAGPMLGLHAHPDDGSESGYLLGTIDEALERLAPLGSPPAQVLHGDYHPGNTRWRADTLVAVLDFDACRLGCAVEEAARAAVHFSLDRTSRTMAARSPWPSTDLFEAFWAGYLPGFPLRPFGPRDLPWIGAGAFARETLAGFGGAAFDDDTVSFATGVVAWLVDHAEGLGEILDRLAKENHGR